MIRFLPSAVIVAALVAGCGARTPIEVSAAADGGTDTMPVDSGPFHVDAGAPGWNADTPLPEEQYLERHAKELCAGISACCGAIGQTISDDVCMAAMLANGREMFAFRKAQGGTYDPVAAGHCVAAVRAATALCTIDRLDPAMIPIDAWCEKVVPGMGNEGDPCHGPGDCKEVPGKIARCLQATPTNLCTYRQRAEMGEPCGLLKGLVCGDDAYCDDVCRPISRAGEACISPNDGQCSTDKCVGDRCELIVLFTAKTCGQLR